MSKDNFRLVKDCITLVQDKVQMVLAKFTVEELVKFTVVDVFDSTKSKDGYQRPLDIKHVNDIYEYFKIEDNSVLPTSIILAADEHDIIFNEKSIEVKNSLRIIDGQHRIAALKKYIDTFNEDEKPTKEEIDQYNEFIKWEYPVNIMILNKGILQDRYIEIRAFVDINKKGKTVSTDLADTSMKNIRKDFESLYVKDAIHQICLLICEKLNEDNSSAWYKSIKEGDSYTKDKPIGVSSFKMSIMAIVRMYLFETEGKEDTYSKEEVERVAEELYIVFRDLWKKIGDKWEDAFCWDTDTKSYRIDLDYNIQKTLGVSSIHKLLKQYYVETKELQKALEMSFDIIQKTKISEKDWIVGGNFSSYTSGSGHNKIKNLIIEQAK